MLGIIIVIGALIGLISIYYLRLKETKRSDRMRVIMKEETEEILNVGTKPKTPTSGWKRGKVDYKAINEAYNKAELYYSKNDYVQAEKCFIQVLALNPDHLDSNNKLGLIYLKKGVANKAEAIYKHLIELDPKNPVFFGNLALAYYNQHQLQEAKYCYEKAIGLDPKRINRYMSLGQVCTDLKDWKAAIGAYSKALELNPKDIELYFTITELLIRILAFDEALAFMNALLEMHPYNDKAKERVREIKVLKGASPLVNQSSGGNHGVRNGGKTGEANKRRAHDLKKLRGEGQQSFF